MVAGHTSVPPSVCIANALSGERQCAGHLVREGGGRGREGEGGGGGGGGGDRLNEERREIFHNEMFFLGTTPSFSFFPSPLPSPSPPSPNVSPSHSHSSQTALCLLEVLFLLLSPSEWWGVGSQLLSN